VELEMPGAGWRALSVRSGVFVRLERLAEKLELGSLSQVVEWLLDRVDDDYLGADSGVSMTGEEAAAYLSSTARCLAEIMEDPEHPGGRKACRDIAAVISCWSRVVGSEGAEDISDLL